MKKNAIIIFLLISFILINTFNILLIYHEESIKITGDSISTGSIMLQIDPSVFPIIHSPLNDTYNFNISDIIELPLEVSFALPANAWKYELTDRHGTLFSGTFTPNETIPVYQFSNHLVVFVENEAGAWINSSVIFYVNISNSPPVLDNISNPIFVCEGEKLNYEFNATDADEEDIVGNITPRNPFYLDSLGRIGSVSSFAIISGWMDKSNVLNSPYPETISVTDSFPRVDSAKTNISVIEINNPPTMIGLGAQTVWLQGENSTFYHQMNITDIEDGETNDSNFEFSLTWSNNENIFDIGNPDGIMNYSPTTGEEGRTYSLTVCAEDNALSNIHDNISLCIPNDGDAKTVCDNFTLTVTKENRAPEIINHTPIENNFTISGTSTSSFFVEVYDKDGTIPDIDWYVDGRLKEHNENMPNDTFEFSFGCDIIGMHNVTIITSDGRLNDSWTWKIKVNLVECPVILKSGGGCGIGGYCMEEWFCDDWQVCQNAKKSFEAEILSIEDYHLIKEICAQNNYDDERFCGFQITTCHDLNNCSYPEPKVPRPPENRICYFTENPSCFDGITNCHHGACELLVDCGGPCEMCPTCSDKKQNQGEEGIDCGGPCPYACKIKEPFQTLDNILIGLSILLILAIIYISYRLIKLFKNSKKHQL